MLASLKQVRMGHHASQSERRFAQITCAVSAKLVWTIKDARGKMVGGVGSEGEPFAIDDLWVFERCVAGCDGDNPAWRLKARLETGSGTATGAAQRASS